METFLCERAAQHTVVIVNAEETSRVAHSLQSGRVEYDVQRMKAEIWIV